MTIREPMVSTLPFEFHGNEILLKGLLARYPKAFRRMAQRFASEDIDDHIVAVPDRKSSIRFFKCDTTIGVAYIGPPGRGYRSFGESFSRLIRDNHARDSAAESPHYGLMQRALHPTLATSYAPTILLE